jgi:predicted N-acetyltransferase YhbS
MNVRLRPPVPVDHPQIARIVFEAFKSIADKHNFPRDFPAPEMASGLTQLFASNPSIFGVVAEFDGQIVGSNFLDQRDATASVGPITVDPSVHGKGIGRRLMQAVIEKARASNAPSIRLVQDAFNTTSMSLYASLGFDAREPLALMRGKIAAPPTAAQTIREVRPMTQMDIAQCAELCRRIHGFDRANELQDAVKMFKPFVLTKEGRVAAYASAPTFWPLNHGVGETEEDLQNLLRGASAASEEPIMMLVPIRRGNFLRWCLASGLQIVKPMTLMAMGGYREPNAAFYPSVGY